MTRKEKFALDNYQHLLNDLRSKIYKACVTLGVLSEAELFEESEAKRDLYDNESAA